MPRPCAGPGSAVTCPLPNARVYRSPGTCRTLPSSFPLTPLRYVTANTGLLRPLAFMLAEWSKRQCINDNRNGYFSSYTLILMLLHYLLRLQVIWACSRFCKCKGWRGGSKMTGPELPGGGFDQALTCLADLLLKAL